MESMTKITSNSLFILFIEVKFCVIIILNLEFIYFYAIGFIWLDVRAEIITSDTISME
jgi:hypothetical protein